MQRPSGILYMPPRIVMQFATLQLKNMVHGKKGTGKKGTRKKGTEKRAQEKWAQEKGHKCNTRKKEHKRKKKVFICRELLLLFNQHLDY